MGWDGSCWEEGNLLAMHQHARQLLRRRSCWARVWTWLSEKLISRIMKTAFRILIKAVSGNTLSSNMYALYMLPIDWLVLSDTISSRAMAGSFDFIPAS